MNTSRRLHAVVVALLVLLFGATTALKSMHDRVRDSRVREHLSRGHALAARRALVPAVDEYRAALWLDRDDREAARGLALALLDLGRLNEAGSYLHDLLKDDPANGLLSRGLARIHAAQGRDAEARTAYQRAIYGEWPAGESGERVATRFELIDYLSKLNARDEVLAELLRLKADLPAGQSSSARRVAELLVEQHADDLATEVLRSAALSSPRDVELLAHLADLLARTGRGAEARTTLRRAIALEPARQDLSQQLAVLDRVFALDPTLPGLRLVTRTRRARSVLAAVSRQIDACPPQAEMPAGFAETLADATRRLRRTPRADAEAAEQELELSARLWNAWPACHLDTTEARAITQVLERVTAGEPQS